MNAKFKIVETEDYCLAVSDDYVKEGDYYIGYMLIGNESYVARAGHITALHGIKGKIIAYLPKNNAPELDLPLLPEIDSVNYVRSLAASKFPINSTNGMMEMLNREQLNNSLKQEGFIEGWEAANKQYLDKNISHLKWLYDRLKLVHNENENLDYMLKFKEIIQSLNQPQTPTHFKTNVEHLRNYDLQGHYTLTKPKLKTELIKGKETLVGNYLFE
jgi:hypothetical protein